MLMKREKGMEKVRLHLNVKRMHGDKKRDLVKKRNNTGVSMTAKECLFYLNIGA